MHREDMQGNTGPVFGDHKRHGKERCTRKKKKKLEGAAVFGWHVGAVVREDRSPRPGRGRRRRFWGTRAKGHAAELGHAACLSRQGRDARSAALRGQQVKRWVHGCGAAEPRRRRGQQHGAACAAASSGSRQRGTGTSHRWSGTGAAPVAGNCPSLPWGRSSCGERQCHRSTGCRGTEGQRSGDSRASLGQELVAAVGRSGRENVWGPGASKHSCSPKPGPARGFTWQGTAEQGAPGFS